MDYLKHTSILESENKTFIHLHSSSSNATETFNTVRNVIGFLIQECSFGGIHFEIESLSVCNSDIEDKYLTPIIPVGVTEDLAKIYRDTLDDFLPPKRLGVLVSNIDRPFLGYKSLALFPHDMVRFGYMIVYHGWREDMKTRHPFLDVFNKFNYLVEYEDDDIYIVKSAI